MALPTHRVLADPERSEQPDVEVRHTDSFLLVRVWARADEPPSHPHNARGRDGLHARSSGSS
ncbi:hypothetical protein Drose_34320 [Dactylosporangium roseum]|uniref:Uncharacterized protein n=1 Tax=Dactylosporangium roseum TaxID=47989 RepID=A0ABY5Z6S0_9ACTN|nr:hypothetical protein [Dactylosporangium roseum]UWZ36089.1 hypothetical protein Drose_34320 [Dactylosporangium roseum]